jgi:deoxycytidylate deaminase
VKSTTKRPGWDEYFMDIAIAVSARADCSRRRIGAVIVKRNRIVATGYNGAPAGFPGCLEGNCPRAFSDVPAYSPYDNCISIHAEANALLYASRSDCEGAVLYSTERPCADCVKLIAGSGIVRVITPGDLEEER